MVEDVITKTSEKFGSVRQIVENGKVLYCASDVAKALGYARPNDAISAHCRYTAKRRIPHPQSPNKQIEMSFIPEGDVYRLITHSKLPSAMEFEKWVFDEVVPEAVNKQLNNASVGTPTQGEQLTLETSEYHYVDKFYNGEPVITLTDFNHFTGITTDSAYGFIMRYLKRGKDYFIFYKRELDILKAQNPGLKLRQCVQQLILLRKAAVDKLLEHFHCKNSIPTLTTDVSAIGSLLTPDEYIITLNVLRNARLKKEALVQENKNDANSSAILKRWQKEIDSINLVISSVASYLSHA